MAGLRAAFLPVGRIAGPAVTVSLPVGGINMLKMAMDLAQAGDILIVDVRGDVAAAMWGGMSPRYERSRPSWGHRGRGDPRCEQVREIPTFRLVTRDCNACSEQLVSPRRDQLPLACGGTWCRNPGDIVVADEDGIVVVPPPAADEILKKAGAVATKLAGWEVELREGVVPDVGAIRDELVKNGCTFIDELQ